MPMLPSSDMARDMDQYLPLNGCYAATRLAPEATIQFPNLTRNAALTPAKNSSHEAIYDN